LGTTRAGIDLLHSEVTRAVITAFFDVHRILGYGYVESVYQRALPILLKRRGVKSEREVPVAVNFLGEHVGDYRADLIVEGKVIVETKVADKIVPVHEMQLLNYLKGTGIEVGLILNFGPRPTFRRLVFTKFKDGPAVFRD
jgi:GxxExxY protein